MYKIKFSSSIQNLFIKINYEKKKHVVMQSEEQFIEYFFPFIDKYEIIKNKNNNDYDIFIYSLDLVDLSIVNENKVNFFISVENFRKWSWYPHNNKFGDFGNKKIDIFYYNHISDLIEKDNSLYIPTVYLRIQYFLKNINIIKPTININFENKKFMLVINRSNLNKDIQKYTEIFNKIDKVDNISIYDKEIKYKSCYNSIELLNVFHQYKFILCLENSYQDGYITEKIFNCFFSKSLPLYKGATDINKFFNQESFIDLNKNNYLEIVKKFNDNKTLYNQYINCNKINIIDNNYLKFQEKINHKILNKK